MHGGAELRGANVTPHTKPKQNISLKCEHDNIILMYIFMNEHELIYMRRIYRFIRAYHYILLFVCY